VSRTYEAVYIFDPTLEESAITEKLTKFHALIPQAAGEEIAVNHWGKRTLAYPINGRETGWYVIVLDEGAKMSTAPTARDGEEDE
jgi:small subunit ribosomal protein S6